MADSAEVPAALDEFFRRWEASAAAERANYSMFLNELCDLLEVPRPDPSGPDDEKNAYVFERAVPFPNPDGSTTVKRVDLYKRDCFVPPLDSGATSRAHVSVLAIVVISVIPNSRFCPCWTRPGNLRRVGRQSPCNRS
jgi:hypothetical protein